LLFGENGDKSFTQRRHLKPEAGQFGPGERSKRIMVAAVFIGMKEAMVIAIVAAIIVAILMLRRKR